LLWRGDFHNARQLLQAMGRRIDRKSNPTRPDATPAESFHLHRRARGHRARVLGKLLVLLEDDHSLTLRRAPDVRRACTEAYGPPRGERAVSLTELLGVIGAHQWREKGVEVPALGDGDRIHPHYGVFSPVRGEYVDLVARAPLPERPRVRHSTSVRERGCWPPYWPAGASPTSWPPTSTRAPWPAPARTPTGWASPTASRSPAPRLYPEGRADLVVCNPPWLPARPTSTVEQGVYDPDGTMLHGFLHGLAAHLHPGGEGWLVLSDLAEHLGLRTREELLTAITTAGLRVTDRLDTSPHHPRARDTTDPLHRARAAEVTSLWRLTAD
jgi:hypothetical protein